MDAIADFFVPSVPTESHDSVDAFSNFFGKDTIEQGRKQAGIQQRVDEYKDVLRNSEEYTNPAIVATKRIYQHAVPFVSAIGSVIQASAHNTSRERIDKGEGNQSDYLVVARQQLEDERQAGLSTAGKVGEGLAGVPALAGEMLATGGASEAPAAAEVGASWLSRLGKYLFGRAVATPATPSLYLPTAAQRSVQQGGSPLAPQNIAPALGQGMIANMVMGSAGEAAAGVKNPATRFIARVGIGMAEQQGADVAATAVDQVLPEAYQTKTRLGLMGNMIRGEHGEALQHAAVQATTFAAFNALHGNPGEAKKVIQETKAILDAPGQPAEVAAKAVIDHVSRRSQPENAPGSPQTAPLAEPAQAPSEPVQAAPEAQQQPPATPGPSPERVEDMRQALLALGMPAKKWPGEKVMVEAARLGVDKFVPKDQLPPDEPKPPPPPEEAPPAPPEPPAPPPPEQGPPAVPAQAPEPAQAEAPGATAVMEAPTESPGSVAPEQTPLQALGERFDRGEKLNLPEVFEAANLTGRERHVIEQRLQGRSHEEIASDQEMKPKKGLKPLSRQRVEQIEGQARAKLGLEESIAREVHAQEQAEGMASRIEAGKAVSAAELHAEPEAAKKVRQKRTKRERELEDAADAFLAAAEEAKKQGYDPESIRRVAREHAEAALKESEGERQERPATGPEESSPGGPEARGTPAEGAAAEEGGGGPGSVQAAAPQPAAESPAARLNALHNDFKNPSRSKADVEGAVAKATLGMDAKALRAVAKDFGIAKTAGRSAKGLREQIVDRIYDRQDRYQRSEEFSKGPADQLSHATKLEDAPAAGAPTSGDERVPVGTRVRIHSNQYGTREGVAVPWEQIEPREGQFALRLEGMPEGQWMPWPAEKAEPVREASAEARQQLLRVAEGSEPRYRAQQAVHRKDKGNKYVIDPQGRWLKKGPGEYEYFDPQHLPTPADLADAAKGKGPWKDVYAAEHGPAESPKSPTESRGSVEPDAYKGLRQDERGWLDKAKAEGIDPGQVRSVAEEMLQADRDMSAEQNELLKEARGWLGRQGKTIGLSRVEEPGQIRGFDEMATALGEKYPALLGDDPQRTLFQMLKTGNRETMTRGEAFRRAYESLSFDFGANEFGQRLAEEERQAGGMGGGQSNAPGGGPARQLKQTALANAMADRERQARGQPPLMKAARLSNPEVWDRAMAILDRDPQAGARLVDELARKPRATKVEENALLLQRKIALSNEHERAMLEFIEAFKGKGDAIDMDRLEARETDLARQRDQLDKVTRATGTEWGRAGQFRRQLAAEDFSLGGMLMSAEAAKGKPLTAEEKVQITELQQRIAALESQLSEAEGGLARSGQGVKSPEYGPWVKAAVNEAGAKKQFKGQLEAYRQARQTWGQRLSDTLIKLRINEVISSPVTLAKIVAASAQRLVTTPIEEAAGMVWSNIPGIAKIAAMAPREGRGLNPTAEKRAIADGLTKGMQDAADKVYKGRSELDILHGGDSAPRTWLDLQFSLHDAMKAPAERAEYTRSFLKRIDDAAAKGQDSTSPAALLRFGAEAYKDAQAAKFRQANWLVDAYNRAIDSLRKPDASPEAKVAGTVGKILTPVVRVPVNLIFETSNYIAGVPWGGVKAGLAWRRGLENLKSAEADAIMRSFKKGSVGLAALLIGYFNPGSVGGFHSGKRDEDDLKPGEAEVGGARIPAWVQHSPLAQTMHFGATVRRAQDRLVKGEKQGPAEGVLAGVAGLAEEIPLVREQEQVAGLTSANARERGWHLGELLKSLAAPQALQWIAGSTDVDAKGMPIKRKPTTTLEHVETGIPGLRQRVPAK